MELQFCINALMKAVTGEQGSKPNPNINPKLLEHHDTNGSITRLTASTIRRQLEAFTTTCFRPRGVSL